MQSEVDEREPVVGAEEEGVSREGVAEPQEPTPQQKNFAALRAEIEAERKQRVEAEDRARRYEQLLMDKAEAAGISATGNVADDIDETPDFSNAVDAEAFAKLSKRFEKREKRLTDKLEAVEMEARRQNLATKDAGYIDVINNYLPGVIRDNPTIKEIIQSTPKAKQFEVMYHFAKTSPSYVNEKATGKGTEKPIEEEKARVNTLGAMKGGTNIVGKESALSMADDAFYGEGGYLAKVLANKIK